MMSDDYDLIIKDAYIVDGSGKAPYKGSVAVKGDKVAALGAVKRDAEKVVEAKGLYASPGWIDAHSHGDSTLLFFPKAESYVMQGVTTFVGGEWLGGVESCEPNPCQPSACCTDEECQMLSLLECSDLGGDWLGGVESCEPDPCGHYACCLGETCQMLYQVECAQLGGDWLEGVESCSPDPCLEYACCIDEACQLLTQYACTNAGGDWRQGLESCDPNPCVPQVYVVDPGGTGDFPTIQAAIKAAADGDIIELTDGIFTGEGNRDMDYLGKAITIRSQSGNPEVCVIDCEGTESDPQRGFHLHSGEQAGSVLEGITIRGGVMVYPEFG